MKALALVLTVLAVAASASDLCPYNSMPLFSEPSVNSTLLWVAQRSEAFHIISPFEPVQQWYEVRAINGTRSGSTGWVLSGDLLPCTLPPPASQLLSYSRTDAVNYASKWWNGANHDCGGSYDHCSPWSYWGHESCGYAEHGGDCANFVSQCLIAGGHPALNQGSPCRGYPCGKEEVGAKNLGDCLHNVHGWTRTCGKYQAPPSNIKVGDVIVYHGSSCSDTEAHATIITGVTQTENGVSITCHSTNRHNVDYDFYHTEFAWYEWLHYPN